MTSKKIDVSLVLACYCEGEHFPESVARIVDVLSHSKYSYEIIFVDDHSLDNTASLVKLACKKYKCTRALYHAINSGRGRAVADGAFVANGEVIGYIDIDLEVGPEFMPQLIDVVLSKKADVAIGRRIYRTSVSSLIREVLSIGYQWLSDVMIGTGKLDTESGYKFFRRTKMLPILKKAQHPHWFWDTETMVLARRAGLSIIEVPVLFLRRNDKTSTVKVFEDTVDYIVNLWKFRVRLQHMKSS